MVEDFVESVEFAVVNQGIEGDIDAGVLEVGGFYELGELVEVEAAGVDAHVELAQAEINSVGTGVQGGRERNFIANRGEQFRHNLTLLLLINCFVIRDRL